MLNKSWVADGGFSMLVKLVVQNTWNELVWAHFMLIKGVFDHKVQLAAMCLTWVKPLHDIHLQFHHIQTTDLS